MKTFSYVSLSGVATVSDERSLAISGLELEDGRPLWERLPRKFAWLGKPASNLIPLAGGVAGAGFDALLSLLASRVLKDAIVVLDDIERKDQNLRIGTIFGAVSRLTEIRGAKVVVIMNEAELVHADEAAAETLSHQREKIFDREFEFRPSVDEALAIIALKGTAEYIEPVAEKLDR
ncbi:MAG TPA: P-loop NTPase fold protein [Chthoniobacterales bacterium]|nr:P-loop NTPase fold protein [Chthoniobacterales bacterium]